MSKARQGGSTASSGLRGLSCCADNLCGLLRDLGGPHGGARTIDNRLVSSGCQHLEFYFRRIAAPEQQPDRPGMEDVGGW